MTKRLYDLFIASLSLLVVGPLVLLIAVAIRLTDSGPVFFSQRRVGLHGRLFHILKFRTMIPGAEQLGTSVTGKDDTRVTAIGRLLRRAKLDELPQLWNVFRGEMSLVGPRPEVPCYVEEYTPEQRRVLELKPGVTDLATLLYRNEEEVLRNADDVEGFYLQEVVPRKIQLNLAYATHANRWEDTKVILRTLFPSVPLAIGGEPSGGTELPGQAE